METEQSNIVKVQYLQNGELKPREYSYFTEERLNVGDEITVPVRDTTGRAIVSAVDVPETEIEAFRDKVKTIGKATTDMPHAAVEEVFTNPEEQPPTTEELFPEAVQVEQQALIKVNPENDPQIVAFYNEAINLQQYAETRVIATAADLKPANDDLNVIRRLKKAMEARRKEYLAPFREHIDEVNDAYKRIMAPVDAADKITSDKMLSFNREQARIRREQEEINRLRMEAAQKDAALHNGEISEPVNLVEVIPEVQKHVSTEMGSSGLTKIKKWEVENIELVPHEYLIVDAVKIGKVVRAGIPSIPGIRIYEETILKTGR